MCADSASVTCRGLSTTGSIQARPRSVGGGGVGVDAAPDEARHIRAGGAPGAACVLGVRQDTAPAHGGGHAARRMGKRMNIYSV